MSHRSIEQKKRNRVAKALRRQPLPAYFDVWDWLIRHGHAKDKGEARSLILAKRLKHDSHVIGVEQVPTLTPTGVEMTDEAMRYVASRLRDGLVVSSA